MALALAGCGGGERAASTPTPTPTPTASAAPTAFAPSAPKPPLQRVRLTLGEGGIRPQRSTVGTILPVQLVVRNATDRERLVTVSGTTKALSVGAGVVATLDLDLRPGTHAIRSEPGGRATLVVRTHEP